MILRAATKQDSHAIFRLMSVIWEDMEFEPWVKLDRALFKSIMLRHIEAEDTKYSYRNGLVATHHGQVVGLLLGYEGHLEPLYDQQLMNQFRHLPALEAMSLTRESRNDEWYLDSIVVDEVVRGQGIGKQFFAFLPQYLGHGTTVGLNCDQANLAAKRLYTSLGYAVVDQVHFSGHQYDHMQKVI